MNNNEPLIKDLYEVVSIERTGDNMHACVVNLNPEHDVFKGHFPGNPIMPGVCTMQIIKELTETITTKKLQLVQASNVKFMALINPFNTPVLKLQIEWQETESGFKIKNSTFFGETVALKLSGSYRVIN